MKFVSFMLLLIGFSYLVLAQKSSIKLIAEVPVHFGIGYEGQISKRFSTGASVGVLTSPNSDLIIAYLRVIGTDEQLVVLVEDAFQLGIVGEVNVNFNFKRNYVGTFAQIIGVQGGDASKIVVEDYFGTTINTSGKITIRTRLYQAGILYGHRFPLNGNRFEIDLEVSLSANIGSTSTMSSKDQDFTELNKRLNTSLDEFYKEYAFIPSFGVMLVYKLNRETNN